MRDDPQRQIARAKLQMFVSWRGLAAPRQFGPAARRADSRRRAGDRAPPYGDQRVSQVSDQPITMHRGEGNPQSLGASGNRGIIDRLDVDPVLLKQEVARLLCRTVKCSSTIRVPTSKSRS